MSNDEHYGPPERPRHLKPVESSGGQMVPYDPYQFAPEDEDFIDLREYWRILVKRRWVVFSIAAIVVVATLLSTLLMKPVYKATATVQIKNEASRILDYEDFEGQQAGGRAMEQFYTTQYEILRSRSLAESVIGELGIVNHPELSGEEGQRSLLGGLRGVIGAIVGAISPGEEESEQTAMQKAVNNFQERLTINPVRNSRLVEVSFESFDPQFAARVSDAVVEQYIDGTMERRYEAGSQARTFLEDQLEEMRIQLEQSDQALMDFAERSGIADLEDRIAMANEGLAQLNQRLNELQSDMVTYKTWNELIDQGRVDSLEPVAESERIAALEEQLAEAETEYASLSQRFKEDYPAMVELQNRMDRLSQQIAEEKQRIVSNIQGRYENMQAQETALQEAITQRENHILALNQRGVQYNILKREYETNRELYDGLLQRMKEIGVAAGVQENNISVIDEAKAPAEPFKPRLALNMSLALFLGLFGGAGLALLLEFLDSTVRRPEDIERLSGRPVLGLIPLVKVRERKEKERKVKQPERQVGHYSATYPASAVSEAFRSLRTSLMFSTPEGTPKVMLVTSPGPSDGKTTTAINLATVMAQNGSRTLLIDADLRRPRLHKDFNTLKTPGLTDRIARYKSAEESKSTISGTDVDNLFVMCAGTHAPNPAELLSSERMKEVIDGCARVFDHVIIDSAPILGLADAMVLSQVVDGVLMVTAAGQTGKDNVKAAVKRLHQIKAPLHGVVLNAVDLDSPEYSYYSSYYYEYGDESDEKKEKKGLLSRVASY